MPRHHEPLTLRKCAIFAIAHNWNLICYSCRDGKEMNELIESDEYLKYESPFSTLPSPFLEDLLNVIGERRSLTRKFFHMLIHEQLQVLNLSFGTGETHHGLQFLLRCKKLKKLNLPYLRHIEPSHIMRIIPHLSSIVSLNLSMTLAVDEMMEMLALHCPNLCELDLTSTMISDKGIFSLCGALGNDSKQRCQQLSRLIIGDTRVTQIGAQAAIRYLPRLSEFDFDKMFKVFERFETECPEVEPNLKLRTLISLAPCVRPESIDIAARYCPKVEVLSVQGAWMDNETFYRFMQFENICSLTVVNTDGLTIDFDEGVLPLLQVCGSTLENLILNKFASVDLIGLGRSCLKLRKLALCSIAEYQLNGKPNEYEPIFSQLTALELWFDSRTEFSTANSLYLLLTSAKNISNLLVKRSRDFTLELLHDIWKVNQMVKLARLTVDGCQALEPELIHEFLTRENELTVLRIWSCCQISRQHRENFAATIKSANLDVYLEWFA